jgi:hypothetical protein
MHSNSNVSSVSCVHEWLDIYTEVDGTDVSELISTPFAGRYCGAIPPRTRISLYGGIAIGFYSDKKYNASDGTRFRGAYGFLTEGQDRNHIYMQRLEMVFADAN